MSMFKSQLTRKFTMQQKKDEVSFFKVCCKATDLERQITKLFKKGEKASRIIRFLRQKIVFDKNQVALLES